MYKFTFKESEGKGEKLVWDCQGFCSSVRERPVNEQRNKQSITLLVCSLCCLFPHWFSKEKEANFAGAKD